MTYIDYSLWERAPREKTPAYFRTFSAVAREIQHTLRSWIRASLVTDPSLLSNTKRAFPLLVYQATAPFAMRVAQLFTYDIQDTAAVDRAFSSAKFRLPSSLSFLDIVSVPKVQRVYYLQDRDTIIWDYVYTNRRDLYRMLNAETILVNSLILFAQENITHFGIGPAVILLRNTFTTQLSRFAEGIDFSSRADELLAITTTALAHALPAPNSPAELA